MPSDLARHWDLDPHVAFLNHGSFGATPRAVLQQQAEFRARMERQPVQFLGRDLRPLLRHARVDLASFVGCEAEDVVFATNATTGVNTVLRWLKLEPGDELLTTNHAYGACKNALDATAAWTGAKVVVASVPFPLESEQDIIAPILAAVTPRTKLAMLDHVTSPTALVFPVTHLVNELAERGIETLVDGAHVPGMLNLDIAAVGPAWYAGNCHKWMCGPKGAGFLYVRRDLQASVHPLVVSHGATQPLDGVSRFQKEFEWAGTQDYSPWLCLPESLRTVGNMVPGGWEEVRQRNHALAVEAQAILCDGLGVPVPCPPEMLGSMAAIPMPAATRGSPAYGWDREAWQQALIGRGYEVPVTEWPPQSGRWSVRVSCQLYNSRDQYERLVEVLQEFLGL
ncbi:MAG: aminotransferase class V-fold PLP-dependent enzyme [Dehalococcoidia bacterium]|nr:aminotransferase class V-fold PLP-dependent enzyme [Dehalococcoidia bacterium]MCA9844001.1 aminotransferase class V-fold PLP-dependent enzyme [Dehalococcoidia bacterium]